MTTTNSRMHNVLLLQRLRCVAVGKSAKRERESGGGSRGGNPFGGEVRSGEGGGKRVRELVVLVATDEVSL